MTTDIIKIRERIAKLLAMAKDTSSPQEAAIAAERARKLMDTHQLTEWDVTPSEEQRCDSAFVTKAYKYMPVWLDILSVAVARYNDCMAVRQGAGRDGYSRIVFHGMADDVVLAEQMFKYLEQQGVHQCKEYMASTGRGSYYEAKVGDAFKKGYSTALCAKLREMTKARDALVTASGTALVVVKSQIIEQYAGITAQYKKASVKSRKDGGCAAASAAGYQTGRAQAVHQSVE